MTHPTTTGAVDYGNRYRPTCARRWRAFASLDVSLAGRAAARILGAATTAGARAGPAAGRIHELLRAPAQRLRQSLLCGGHPQHAGELAQLLLRLLRSGGLCQCRQAAAWLL